MIHNISRFIAALALLATAQGVWAQEAIDGLTYNSTGGYYEINDEQDLIDLATYVNAGNNASGKTFKQTQDITMTGSNFTPIGVGNSHYFGGTYDGGGYTISGLYISYSQTKFAGLFNYVEEGTVRNVILVSPSVTNTHTQSFNGYKVGALIAYTFHSTAENCHVVSPTLNATGSGNKYYGALVGESGSSSDIFTNCCYYTDNASLAGIGNSPRGDVSRAYTVTLGDGVTTSTAAAFTCKGTDYYKSGAIVTLPAAPAGYINAYTVNGLPIDGTSFTISADATVALSRTLDPAHFADNGDGTYTIKTATGWSVFCDCLDDNDTYNRFSGKTVKLGGDIGTAQNPITRMAGSDHLDFCGTFDGQDHTLTVDISSDSRRYTAPFAYVSETTPTGGSEVSHPAIRNLNVTGTVNATKEYASGLVGAFWGTLTIENCTSSVTVNTSNKYAAGFISNAQGNAIIRNCLSSATINSTVSGDGTHAGFIGVAGSVNLNIEGCAFTGSLIGTSTTSCAGFVGYGGTVTITNSLYAPAEVTVQNDNSATFARGNTPATTNSYYSATLGTAQGKAVRTVTAGDDVTISGIALTGSETAYNVSHITAYANGGLKRGDVLYYGSDDQLALTLSNSRSDAPLGYQYSGYTASAGTLSGSDADGWTLTMPDADMTISVDTNHPHSTGEAVAVSYVLADGTTQQAQAIALDGTEYSIDAGIYFVGLPEVNFNHGITLNGNVTLILKDGCAMNVGTDAEKISATGIDGSDYAIDIYAQSLGNDKGTLAIYTKGTNHRGISVGDVNVNGGNVNVNNGAQGIFARGDITVNGGSVTVNSTGTNDAIQTPKGDITINGGTVNATGTKNGIYAAGSVAICGGSVNATGGSGSGINANNGITLGWNKPTDRISITASSYEGTVKVADGKKLHNGSDFLGGTLGDPATDVNGKTLRPAANATYTTADGTADQADAILLDASDTSLPEGNYLATGTLNYTHGITLTGNVTLILADNCHMNVGTSGEGRINGKGIAHSGFPTLTITSEANGSGNGNGALNIYTTGSGNHGIITGAITINGGNVTADTDGYIAVALYAADTDLTINGGTVSATVTGSGANAIYAYGNVNYNGGNVTATAAKFYAIYAVGNYTFSWRTPADRITIGATGLYAPDDKTATFARLFTDGSGNYYGATLTGPALNALKGVTLEAAETADFTVTLAPKGYGTYYDGHYDITLPAGTQARIVTARGGTDGTLDYETIADGDDNTNNTIPAGTAVMLCHDGGGPVTLTVHDADIDQRDFTKASGNTPGLVSLLHGSDVAATTTGGTLYYKLTYGSATGHEDIFGWYWGATDGAAFESPAHKAWLALPATSLARSFIGLPDSDDNTTGITTTNDTNDTNSAGAWYTLDGRKLDGTPMKSGIYVNNGKMVIIK